MQRELPRTLFTLSCDYQKNIDLSDYEIIVIDNGSKNKPLQEGFNADIKYLTYINPTHSPAKAINMGLSQAKGELIGLMIDGARMASPNLLSAAISASSLHKNPVISSIAYHLGNQVQMKSVLAGYDQDAEDTLLSTVDWRNNGYKLFEISVLAGSSNNGWFLPIAESNAFFLKTNSWKTLGGIDERFQSPGGGLVNLDIYKRAIELPNSKLISLLGEGTFHQVHGGIATNLRRTDASWNIFNEEYKSIRGEYYKQSQVKPYFFGGVRPEHAHILEESITKYNLNNT